MPEEGAGEGSEEISEVVSSDLEEILREKAEVSEVSVFLHPAIKEAEIMMERNSADSFFIIMSPDSYSIKSFGKGTRIL